MGIIRELPPSVINQIAAGEVIERPASVVKELLENAIDAGAKRVELALERGGKDLIRVADDGAGMSVEDLPLAFRPHATSKLSAAEDLFRIATLGFRGEALAAIAEVSRVRCQSRTHDAPEGAEIVIEAGVAGEVRPSGSPPGTIIEVRNLFHNTPVRRTFLKADSTESGHVVEAFTRIALAHPTVHLTLRSGGRIQYDLPAVTGIKDRIAVFLGQELADSLLWVESEVESTHLWGYVAHPSQSRSSTKGQYLFVGGRYVRDKSLAHALSEAYRGLLMVGRLPVAFLFLELPAEDVDVNVHPAKIEVRFRDSHRIYSQLLSTVRQTFLRGDLHARLQAPPLDPRAIEPPPFTERGAATTFSSSDFRHEIGSWFRPSSATAPPLPVERPAPEWSLSLPPKPVPDPGRLFDEFGELPAREESVRSARPENPPAAEYRSVPPSTDLKAIQLHDSYLVVETPEGMVVFDQHALHERILFEELKSRLERGEIESQALLVPEPVELSPVDAAAVAERQELLERLGMRVEPFGGSTLLVSATPALLARLDPAQLLRDLADHLRGKPIDPSPEALLHDVMSMVACKAAVKANQRLSADEIAALVSRRDLVADAHHCPHGRPTALTFTKSELERQFGRV